MEAVARVHVHPVVLLSIVDAYEKRPEFNDQIIGTLLGMVHDGEVSMKLSFSQTMLSLERKVSRYSRPVGWFSTGSEVTEAEHLIHKDNYKKSQKNPIFLLVNPNLMFGEKMSIQAFQSQCIGPKGDLSYLYNLTNRLLALLEKVNSKVEDYAKGEKPVDSDLGMAISRLLFATPKLDAENVEDLISSSFKDLLMVTYLTNMIRAHAKILSIAH
nr:eukaryotic translation initiation factor 3 [Hymenolepis microstoma]